MTAPRYHSRRLRHGRFSEPGRPYLVTTCTYRRHPWFADPRRGRLVVRALAAEAPCVQTLCFVVMPDHLHWLLVLDERQTLAAVMRRVKSVSARRLRSMVPGGARIWQDGFHDHALRRQESLRETARYVVMNPVRAGLVQSVGDYPLWDACWL